MKRTYNVLSKRPFSLSMLKFLLLGVLIVSLFGTTSLFSQDNNFLVSDNVSADEYKSTLPKITINDKGKDGVVIKYRFKGVVLSPIYVEGDRYFMPHIYGLSHLENIGAPRLPVRNLHIALPAAVKPAITIIDAEYKDFTKKKIKIHPAMAPHPDCYNCPQPKFSLNPGVYEKDAMFPAKPLKVISVDTFRGVPIAIVRISPIQYNPVTGQFRFYSKLKFKVTFNGAQRSFNRFSKYSEVSNRMVKRFVLNRDTIPRGVAWGQLETRAAGKDYIIITHSNYLSQANDLANWKRQLGYSVEVVSQSSWTAAQIDTALKDRYNSWDPKPLFFLIIGDENTAPPEYTGSRYTDLYFAEMDGSGYKPDMAYGRLPVSSTTEATTVVNKIINYEQTPPTLSSFYTHTTAAAMYQDTDNYDSYADRRFCHTSEDIRNYLIDQGYTVNRVYATGSSSVDPIYYNNGYYSPSGMQIPSELQRPNFDWEDDYNDINNSLDAGRFMLTHRDHGGTTLWGDPEYTTTHIGYLSNGSLLPVVFSINCLTGKYVTSTECFAEKFLTLSNAGCVGIFAATEVSYSGYNDGYACGAMDAIWPDPGIDPQFGSGGAGNSPPSHSPIYTMGDVLNHSKTAMEYFWGTSQTTWELHHYYGDPAMHMWTAQPTTTTASHTSSLTTSDTSLSITSSNCANGIATLVYEDTLQGKTTLSAGGTGTITFSALSGSEANAILTISKHNFKPYVANIPVDSGPPPPPVADFSASTTNVMAGGSVTFTDLSTNSPTSWSWTFAGGTPGSSTAQNPTITYNTAGTYTVSLTAANSSGSDTETKTNYITVTALQPPVADFTASATTVYEGDSVTFTDTSTGSPTSWSWTFAGGTPSSSTTQNPSITYNTAGTYTVELTATNAAGSDTETKTNFITVQEAPIEYCSASGNDQSYEYIAGVEVGDLNNSSGASGYSDFTSLTAHLDAGASVSVSLTPGFVSSSYNEYWTIWIDYNIDGDFEDSGEQVFQGYSSSTVTGSFTVPETASGLTRMRVGMQYSSYLSSPCGTFTYGEIEDYTVDIESVTPQPPVADFTADSTSIMIGESVNFTDQSTNNPTSWSWTFQGGTPSSSTNQNPTVTYNTVGTYTVTLTATNSVGSDTETKVGYVAVAAPQPPVANFTASATSISVGGSVSFTDTSTNSPTSWSWTFAGGTPGSSTTQNPTITYNTAGTYTVSLTATNSGGSDTETKTDYITVSETLPTVGITDVLGSTSVSANRRAMPFTMPESGTINSVTMYHEAGSGSMILAVYDGEGTPQNRLAVSATTAVSGSAGWQTVNLTSSAYVSGGATVWLAWVYESNPGIAYQTGSPGRYQSTDTWSGGMPDPFGSGSFADYRYSIYAEYTPGGGPSTGTVGITTIYGSTSVSTNRRAMPFTMPEDGTIKSVSMYHEAGSGGLILAVYDGTSAPTNRLAVTSTVTCSSTAGWQTVNLTSPVFVSDGTQIWLAWVYEDNPGIAYQTGSPGRYQSTETWSGGMPDPFGSGSQADYLYSIYATYDID